MLKSLEMIICTDVVILSMLDEHDQEIEASTKSRFNWSWHSVKIGSYCDYSRTRFCQDQTSLIWLERMVKEFAEIRLRELN